MNGFKKLLGRCKCGVFLTINEHRDYYQSVADRLDEFRERDWSDFTDEEAAEMLAADTIVELQFYPDTPGGFYCVVSHDLDVAIKKALACLGLEE